MQFDQIQEQLVSEIKLSELEARIFLLITTGGTMNEEQISREINIPIAESSKICKQLMEKGAFIDITKNTYEAMHPRFTAVNMYRKMCEKNGIEFKRNKIVDNIGVVLEKFYDAARTK